MLKHLAGLVPLWFCLVGTTGLAANARAAEVDIAHSRISIVFRAMAAPIEAQFKRFSAKIDYDATKPETAKATVVIDTGSLDLGDPEYNKVVVQKDWLDAARYPSAHFNSGLVKVSPSKTLMVSGQLTIKGKTADLSIPVTVKTENGADILEGKIPIRRLAFNLGAGEWSDTSVIADDVVIAFRLVLTK
ncbi:MAG: YceI family protein [Formivibrio sp.]|nr:YceI family protein [Formivibrio sp.]